MWHACSLIDLAIILRSAGYQPTWQRVLKWGSRWQTGAEMPAPQGQNGRGGGRVGRMRGLITHATLAGEYIRRFYVEWSQVSPGLRLLYRSKDSASAAPQDRRPPLVISTAPSPSPIERCASIERSRQRPCQALGVDGRTGQPPRRQPRPEGRASGVEAAERPCSPPTSPQRPPRASWAPRGWAEIITDIDGLSAAHGPPGQLSGGARASLGIAKAAGLGSGPGGRLAHRSGWA